jgi:hypothetical protein
MNLVIRTKVLIAEDNPQVAKELEKLLNLTRPAQLRKLWMPLLSISRTWLW